MSTPPNSPTNFTTTSGTFAKVESKSKARARSRSSIDLGALTGESCYAEKWHTEEKCGLIFHHGVKCDI